ncbi:MAG TPA: hypothetical protein DEB05_10665 [Firmicutes bacterium]|nr:hypothetical protein [Bacillota bacterium]HBT17402.1 hypothetical protein [Bacillota bacterium]
MSLVAKFVIIKAMMGKSSNPERAASRAWWEPTGKGFTKMDPELLAKRDANFSGKCSGYAR